MDRSVIISCLSIISAILPSVSASQSWESEYLKAERADQLNVCVARISFSNGFFSARLYGDNFDFLLRRDDFTLPYDAVLGVVTFNVDGQEYLALASTFERGDNDRNQTAQLMLLDVRAEDATPLFNALRLGTSLVLEFPNGSRYNIPLRSSDRALSAASNCWSRNATGPLENNPFSSDDDGSNPFAAPDGNPFLGEGGAKESPDDL